MKLSYAHVQDTDQSYYRLLRYYEGVEAVDQVYPFGSRYTSPDGQFNDTDILILSTNLARLALDAGWTSEVNDYEDGGFSSLRDGDVNLIVCQCKTAFFQRAAAAELCRAQGYTTRRDRVAIHAAVRGDDFDL